MERSMELLTFTHYQSSYIGDWRLSYTLWIIDFLQLNIVWLEDFTESAIVDVKVRVFQVSSAIT